MKFDLIAPCPLRPDIDCIAGAVAYAELCNLQGRRAAPWLCGKPDGAAQFYLDLFPDVYWATDAEAHQAAHYALIDYSTPVPLPAEVDVNKVSVVIDHRFLHDPQHDFPNADVQLESVGAAATLIAEKFMAANIVPSRASMAMLHGAIHSNTLGFKSDLTTDRDRKAFDWLGAQLPDAEQLITGYQAAHRNTALANLPQTLRDDTKTYQLADGPYYFSQIEITDARDVWRDYKPDIIGVLDAMGPRTILNLVDVSAGVSVLFTADAGFRDILGRHYQQTAVANDAMYLSPPQMRKQLASVLQAG